MPWRKETPAKVTEALVEAHEHKVQGRQLRDNLATFEGTSWQVREVTGQEPLDDGIAGD